MPRPKKMDDNLFAELLINCPREDYFSYSANHTTDKINQGLREDEAYRRRRKKESREWKKLHFTKSETVKAGKEDAKTLKEKLKVLRLTNQKLTTIDWTRVGSLNKT